jgi:hypothetical protein
MDVRDWVILGESIALLLMILARIVQSRSHDKNNRADFDDLRWKLSEISKQIDGVKSPPNITKTPCASVRAR